MLVWNENRTAGIVSAQTEFGPFTIRKVKNKYRIETPTGGHAVKTFNDAEEWAESVYSGMKLSAPFKKAA